jgi:tetratricopeptide (TPR) repeat protein
MEQAQGNPDAARQVLDPLLVSKTGEFRARNELGFVEAKAGNYAKAIEHLRKVVEAEPQNVIALNNLAYLLADHTTRVDEALKYALKAKELAPNDIMVDGTLGWAYFQKGMYEVALRYLKDAVNREEKNVVNGTAIRRYHLAMAYAKTSDEQNASKALNAALKLDPNLPEAETSTRAVLESK